MLTKKQLVYHFLSFIPYGKVVTYGQINQVLKIGSARAVGQILHQNQNPKIPCFKVVFADGGLAKNYGFGGIKKQEEFLKKNGAIFVGDRLQRKRVDLDKCLWRPTKVLELYFTLLKRFGFPGPWPWFNQGKRANKEEIVIGSLLTQNTNWRNVEKALENLRKSQANCLEKIYQLGKEDVARLKKLIRPSGFYNQKAERLWRLSKFIMENYGSLTNFFKLSLDEAREKLLSLKGIGQETADTILLYAAKKPIFVVDNYTKRFVGKYLKKVKILAGRSKVASYQILQQFFMDNLPKNTELFQNYHALIVKWGKTDKT